MTGITWHTQLLSHATLKYTSVRLILDRANKFHHIESTMTTTGYGSHSSQPLIMPDENHVLEDQGQAYESQYTTLNPLVIQDSFIPVSSLPNYTGVALCEFPNDPYHTDLQPTDDQDLYQTETIPSTCSQLKEDKQFQSVHNSDVSRNPWVIGNELVGNVCDPLNPMRPSSYNNGSNDSYNSIQSHCLTVSPDSQCSNPATNFSAQTQDNCSDNSLQDQRSSESHQSSASSGHSAGSEHVTKHSSLSERPKRRRGHHHESSSAKICGICGDAAKSMHFGGMACDSCKAFFRRSVQTNSYEAFKCSAQSKCSVSRENRKSCQFCRFQKCTGIGMEVRWVMPQSERIELWRSKLARHRGDSSVPSCSQSPPKSSNTICKIIKEPQNGTRPEVVASPLSSHDREAIQHVTILQEIIFASIPYPTTCTSSEDLSNIFFCICQKLQKFFFRIEEFHELCLEDQACVMKNGIAAAIYLHGVYLYDTENKSWPSPTTKDYLRVPYVSTSILIQFTVFPEIFETLMSFYTKYGNDIKDESVLALLSIIALFFTSHNGLKGARKIIEFRNYYIGLLKRYLIDQLGPSDGKSKFPFLMNAFEHVKRIVTFHNKVAMQPNIERGPNVSKYDISFTEQLTAIIEGLKQAKITGLPQFSSVLGPVESSIPPRSVERNCRIIQSPSQPMAYSWLTSVIFGSETKTDRLLSFVHPEILVQKRPTITYREIGKNAGNLATSDFVKIREVTSDEYNNSEDRYKRSDVSCVF